METLIILYKFLFICVVISLFYVVLYQEPEATENGAKEDGVDAPSEEKMDTSTEKQNSVEGENSNPPEGEKAAE